VNFRLAESYLQFAEYCNKYCMQNLIIKFCMQYMLQYSIFIPGNAFMYLLLYAAA